MKISLKDYQKLVHPGDHMVLLYENEDEVLEPITSYISGCVERNERCIYIYGDTDVEALEKSLRAEIDYDKLVAKQQIMMLKKSEAYSSSGEFVPDKMVALLQSLVRKSIEDGYQGMGVTGEISWVLDYDDGLERIYEYEWKLNDRVFNEFNLSAVCRYNMKKFSDEAIKNIIQLHPIIYYKNRIHENPYYLPPVAYEKDRIVEYQVNTWLKNIEDYSNTKSVFNFNVEQLQKEKAISSYEEKEKIIEEYNMAINKSLEKKLDLQSSFVVDLAKKRVLESNYHGDDIDFKNKAYQDVFDQFLKQIKGEADKVFFENSFSHENLMNAYYNGENISTKFNMKINEKVHLIDSVVEFRQSPFTDNPIAFMYFYNITYKNATEKMLSILIEKQNDLILKRNRKYDRVVIYSKNHNDFGIKEGFMTLDTREFKDVYQRIWENLLIKNDDLSDDRHDFDKLEIGESVTDTFNLDIGGETVYKQVLSYRADEDTIFNIISDVSDVVNKEKEINEILNKALKSQEEANRAKSEFMARMSHDMRTPLAAIIGLSEFGIEEAENEEINRYFRKIRESSAYMLNLVNDILDMQKIEENKMEIKKGINILGDMIEPVMTLLKPDAERKNIRIVQNFLSKDTPKYIVYDSKRIQQVFVNILSNAIKYSEKNSAVIWNNSYEVKNGKAYFRDEIIDKGVGMSREFQRKMFEPFATELNKMSTSESGTGLGLAITKNLVELMGGEIYCESELGKGTTITTVIPVEISNQEEYEKQEEADKTKTVRVDYSGTRILICDDTRLNAEILSRILKSRKIETDIASNGQDGVAMALENKYDMIIMDIRMPEMDGLQASRLIREKGINIPIIAFSANAYEEDIRKSIEAGMNEHLSKPIDKDHLFRVISEYLN